MKYVISGQSLSFYLALARYLPHSLACFPEYVKCVCVRVRVRVHARAARERQSVCVRVRVRG